MIPTACRAALLAGAAVAGTAQAQSPPPACDGERCVYRVTPQQLLAKAEELVLARDFARASPLVDALGQVPEYGLQRRFLAGYIAAETGDLDTAIGNFRAILADDPRQTRVRLELARALVLKGNEAAADHHLRLAQEDGELPEEITRTIRSTRGILRSRRIWNFNVDLGFAPDTNINNATSADTIEVNFGPIRVPVQLDDQARQRSGIGQTAGFSGGVRLPVADELALLVDTDGNMVNYEGENYDDVIGQLAVGPEFQLGSGTSASLQGVGLYRWYGGQLATRQFGVKAGVQKVLDRGQRVGLQLDGRRTHSGFSSAYDGWQLGGYAIYERVIARSMIASVTLSARRDLLDSRAYSSTDYGVSVGIGGELPLGINAGISGGVGRTRFDAPVYLFSDDERSDWRFDGRAYLGLRSVRLLGFSPSLTYTFNKTDSSYDLYRSDRHRVRFNLARYF